MRIDAGLSLLWRSGAWRLGIEQGIVGLRCARRHFFDICEFVQKLHPLLAGRGERTPERHSCSLNATRLSRGIAMDILRTFHLHMISDATGETLITIAKAVRVQYAQVRAIEHLHPLVRSRRELERVVKDVEAAPGIVLYTLFNRELADELEKSCKRLNIPCVPALKPILQVFESYLGTPSTPTVGGQHVLDADYFRRIEALNFTMLHDDGHLPENLNDADIVLVGISRTSKTPTSIYLANRGFKTANVPLVPGVALPPQLEAPTQRLRGRPGGERRAHRPGPPEPRHRACASVISRTMSTARRSPPRSPRRGSFARATAGRSST